MDSNHSTPPERRPGRARATLGRIVDLYVDGFKSMTVGRALWALIIIKCIVLFAILKVIFFPDLLATRYDNDADRAQAVRTALTKNIDNDNR